MISEDNTGIYDLAIIGSGPAALAAAIYSARDAQSTLVIDKSIFGGQVATIAQIDNYPGFTEISGAELAEKLVGQAKNFGAEFMNTEVSKIECKDNNIIITTDTGEISAKTALIASGSAHRKLGIPGEENAHYCATCDGPFYRDKNLVVIGGANAAVQESLFLAKFAKHIDLVCRGNFAASPHLMAQLRKNNRITTHVEMAVKRIIVKDGVTVGVEFDKKTLTCDGVFIFAGQTPATEFLPISGIKLDNEGYIMTDAKLMTSLPGVFAAGDVRSGTVKQIAVAVGEGATVARYIRDYIEGNK